MTRTILSFGLLIAALLVLFQLSEYRLFHGDLSSELIVAIISIVFFFLGIYFRKKFNWGKNNEGVKANEINHEAIKKFNLSSRELEVLELIVQGYSNKEIADQLFLAESTIKTHVSNLYQKLEVNKRPQAINKARDLKLVIS